MKALMEINDCRECPFHKSYDVETPDSFDNFSSIHCGKIDSSDGRGRRICQVDGPEKAPVPSWCPHIIERYKDIVERMDHEVEECFKKRRFKMQIKYPHRELTSQILQELEKHSFYKFVYHAALRPTERDKYLAIIASTAKNVINPYWIPEIYTLDAEDIKIIEDERAALLNNLNGASTDIAKSFNQERRKAIKNKCPVVLKTELAVPLAIFMADAMLATIQKTVLGFVELKFIDRGKNKEGAPRPVKTAELHYRSNKTKGGMSSIPTIDANLCRILKEIFSINTLKIFVNGTQVPYSPIKL